MSEVPGETPDETPGETPGGAARGSATADGPLSVRALGPNDVEAYRALRLEALRYSPEAFSSSFEEEAERPLERFAERLAPGGDARVYGAFLGGALVGMTGFYRDAQRKGRHKGWVWGVYVQPAARGRRVGRALLDAVLAHARAVPGLLQVQLGVSVGNAPASALYAACGFVQYGVEPRALVVDGRPYDEALLVLHLD